MALFHSIKTEVLTQHARSQSSVSDLTYTFDLSSYPVFLNHPSQPHGSSCLLNIPGTCYLKVFTRAIFFLPELLFLQTPTQISVLFKSLLQSHLLSEASIGILLFLFIPPIFHFCIFYIPEVTWIYPFSPHGTYHLLPYYIPYYIFFIILTFIVSLCPAPAPFPQI